MERMVRGVWLRLGIWGLVWFALLVGAGRVAAQVPTTTVQDVVYEADGKPASGTVVVSWGSFTTPGGTAIPAGSTSVVLGAGGQLNVSLAPNLGGSPTGSYYTATYHLADGTTSREYWVIPVTVPGGGPAKLAAIRNQVLPTTMAMQTVSKQYVDQAVAQAATGYPMDSSPYVQKSGDTMTGPLVLPGDPATDLQASDKHYVDVNVTALSGAIANTVSTRPGATQTVAQPSGTSLEVNELNGELYSDQYVSGSGNNAVANALASPDCQTGGCTLHVEPNYRSAEQVDPAALPSGTRVQDLRNGRNLNTSANPGLSQDGYVLGQLNYLYDTEKQPDLSAANNQVTLQSYPLMLQNEAVTGGSNQFPAAYESVPYFKTTYGGLYIKGDYYTQGQHVQLTNDVNCYAVGDCLAGAQTIMSSGGFRDSADEGTHPYDLVLSEDTRVFAGTCAAGCTTGSTQVTVSTTVPLTEGEGRYLLDRAPGKVISGGTLTGATYGTFGTANFAGTNFAASVFVQLGQAALSQLHNIAPGTVTLGIVTSGAPSGYATNTLALPAASGVACVADPQVSSEPQQFETAPYTVVDGTHVQLTLNKVHPAGATLAVGGLCGYGLEETVDTQAGIRQVFPVVGAVNATTLLFVQGSAHVLGRNGTTSGFFSYSNSVAAITRTGGVVTLRTPDSAADNLNGLTVTVSGVADPSFNGTYVVTSTSSNTITYANAGADASSTGGNVSVVTGGFALYPMAEVLSVLNPATNKVDGALTLAPNTVPWAAGDAVEQPHYYQIRVVPDTEFVTQYQPRPDQPVESGKYYQGLVSSGLVGWTVRNQEAATDYLSDGGTHSLPNAGFLVGGPWTNSLDVEAGARSVLRVHCNLHGCGRWDSVYDVLDMDSATGEDVLSYAPQSSTATWTLGGTNYTMSPTALTAGTINVGTLNATTITGGVSGGSITSGTIAAARLPVFGPSGATHAPGAVPDPGSVAGNTRFLREDGTWSVPTGTGGSGTGGSGSGGSGSGGTAAGNAGAVQASNGSGGFADSGCTATGGALSCTTSVLTSIAPTGNRTQVVVGSSSTQSGFGVPFDGVMTLVQSGKEYAFLWNSKVSLQDGIALAFGGAGDTSLVGAAPGVLNCNSTAGGAASCTLRAGLYHEMLTTPASSAASCAAGDFTDDANYHYVCVAANTWKRVALSSF